MKSHNPELEGMQKYQWVQLSALHGTAQESHHVQVAKNLSFYSPLYSNINSNMGFTLSGLSWTVMFTNAESITFHFLFIWQSKLYSVQMLQEFAFFQGLNFITFLVLFTVLRQTDFFTQLSMLLHAVYLRAQ